ncbi:MAG: IPT/TIG domain-containing protein, partial [Acidobacteriia bacterium]|nr:IPT/TIG domain-containing protein [Terriglobia bacterium]
MQMASFRASGQGGSSNPAPIVTSITPNMGTINGGTGVTITGTGFLAGATVSLGGTATTGVTMMSGTSISATTAAHSAGSVSVVVTNTDGQNGTLTNGYTYTNPAPTVISITPNAGSANGGTSVTIAGAGFLTGATVKLGGTTATNVTVNGTSITATTPAHAGGTANVTVTNPDGQSGVLANGYNFTSGLGLVLPAGDPSSVTVNAGQTATYTLSLGGVGMSGTASLTCATTPTPKGVNCSVPASVPFNSTVPAIFTFSVTTTSPTIAALHPSGSPRLPWSWTLAMTMLGIVVVPTMKMRVPRRSRGKYLWLAPLTLCLFLASCGGGSVGGGNGGGQQTNPNATAPGTYTLTLHATSGSATDTTSLTLIVR